MDVAVTLLVCMSLERHECKQQPYWCAYHNMEILVYLSLCLVTSFPKLRKASNLLDFLSEESAALLSLVYCCFELNAHTATC